jgi:hypothetical protein
MEFAYLLATCSRRVSIPSFANDVTCVSDLNLIGVVSLIGIVYVPGRGIVVCGGLFDDIDIERVIGCAIR